MVTDTTQAPASNGAMQAPQQQNGVQRFSENTVENVLTRISAFQTQGGLKLPANYSAENAVRSAWLIIQETKNLDKKPALEVCTRESVANALLDMVLQGLNPVKKQCYFIVMGNKLVMMKSYIGTMMIGKRVAGVSKVRAVPIYKGDEFTFEVDTQSGVKKITKHVQLFENIDPANVTGAYAIVTYNDGAVRAEIMSMKQIKSSWEMGQAKGNSKAHLGFADEMACKTVIGRALKTDIGSSDDGDLFEEPEMPMDPALANVTQQIEDNANKNEIGFTESGDNAGGTTDENVDTETGELLAPTATVTQQPQPVQQKPQPQQQATNQVQGTQQNIGGPGF